MLKPFICLAFFSTALLFPAITSAQVEWPDLSQPAPAEGGGENDAAIVIGIENYAFVQDIPGAVQNANDWYAWLTRTRQVPLGKVALLRDNDATKESILSAVRKTVDKVGDGGTLWLIFIGHGAPSKDGTDGLLLGVDTMQTADSVYARGLPQSDLLDELGKGGQEQTIVVLDACFSGKTGFGDALVDGLQPLVPQYALQTADVTVLSAGQADQFAGPLSGAARPAFSYLLLGGIRGWADADGDGGVSAAEAVGYTTDAMYALLRDRTQTPQLHGPGGDAVLSHGVETGPDVASIVLGSGTISARSTLAGTVSTGLDVDLAAKAREAERLRLQREALEEQERAINAELEANKTRRLGEVQKELLDSAEREWSALAGIRDVGGSEAIEVVELYIDKYDAATVTVDETTVEVEISFVGEAARWLRNMELRGSVIDSQGYSLVRIEAGSFLMGSPEDETGRNDDEHRHRVRISRPFAIGATEVTRSLWGAVVGEDLGSDDDGRLPVKSRSWLDAVDFCNRLSEMEGLTPAYVVSGEDVEWDRSADGYRLPTEAEWEYAARANDRYVFSGSDHLEEVSLCSAEYSLGPSPVGERRPNGWGLYDMSGNVSELVWDGYGEYSSDFVVDPVGQDSEYFRVIRGGFWHAPSHCCRVASRYCGPGIGFRNVGAPAERSSGFRVVRNLYR